LCIDKVVRQKAGGPYSRVDPAIKQQAAYHIYARRNAHLMDTQEKSNPVKWHHSTLKTIEGSLHVTRFIYKH